MVKSTFILASIAAAASVAMAQQRTITIRLQYFYDL